MKQLLVILFVSPFLSYAQPLNIKKTQSGIFSLGMRTTISTFNGGDFGNSGYGVGGQYRIQLSNYVNTDWFFDYITSDVEDFAKRTDYHIGWSVLCYFTKKPNPIVKPYILMGHCFDGTKLVEKGNPSNFMSLKSSAVQAGGGFHLNVSERFDVSLVTQYMIHLGGDVHAHRTGSGSVAFEKHKGAGLEGHLLFHVGLNYKIADLW